MAGQFKPVKFEPYRRRAAWRLPRWLVLVLLGGLLGAAGVIGVQQRLLPPRLSPEESRRVQSGHDRAVAERERLAGELARTAQKLEQTLAEKNALATDLAGQRQTSEQLRAELASVVIALPPDPRGGEIQVRAARLAKQGQDLAYDVVLTRERAGKTPLNGVVQFVVSGENGQGVVSHVALPAVTVQIAGHYNLRGALPLPIAFKPRQGTITVLDRPGGRQLGMRVILVQ